MINRSTIKYHLKKILPKGIFKLVLILWQKILLHIVEVLDKQRIKQFSSYRPVTLTHNKSTFSLFISPENGFIDKHIFLYGVYEPFILDLISVHLKKGGTFVDIGANIGQHSMYAATLVGATGQVHAFEPIPTIYKQLTDSVAYNNFTSIIHAHNCALGDKNSEEKLHVSKNVGGSSLVNDDDTKEVITVSVRNGDDELGMLSEIDMIKIDVEGYEYEVLSGIQKTLKKHSPVMLLEFSGEFYAKQGSSNGAKILNLLRKNNYTLFDIEDDMKKVTDDMHFDKELSTTRKQTNLLCIVKQ